LLLCKYLMDVSVTNLLNFIFWFVFFRFAMNVFLLLINGFIFFFLLLWKINFLDQLIFSSPLLLFLLIFFIFHFILFRLFVMLWFCFTEITIKFILSWTTLYVILFIFIIGYIYIAEITFVLGPKGVLFHLFFTVHQRFHFCASSLAKCHLLDCIILRFNGSLTLIGLAIAITNITLVILIELLMIILVTIIIIVLILIWMMIRLWLYIILMGFLFWFSGYFCCL
jgi:hypothetical protein